jgi:U6 snRNA-associated Sm-like protein LSm1
MERLSINDPPAGGQHGNQPQGFQQQNNNMLGPMTQGPPQLPPQMFTTAAQLLDLTDSVFCLIFDVKLWARN